MGKKTGTNSKVVAAKEHQASLAEARNAKVRAAQEEAEARDWAKGSNQRASKRETDASRKQEEKMAKVASKKALEEAEAKELKGAKSVVKPKGKKVDIPPWEAALMSSATSKKGQKKAEATQRQKEAEEARKAKAERAAAEAKALRDAGIQMADDMAPMEGNPNRTEADDTDWASGLDAALGVLSLESGAGGAERHPEKRLKAALIGYEERELPRLREEKPGLKLRQYKQMIFEQWKRSPENPVNRARAAEAEEAAAAAAAAWAENR